MRTCSECDTKTADARARYCSACGSRLGLLADAGAHTALIADPIPRAVEGWTTEIRHSTVLYVDLVRSTEMVACLNAEQAMHRLQPILDNMCRSVEECGGVVLGTAGDGVVALFGAIRTDERHAELACHAALALRDAIKVQDRTLTVRAGLHSGEVVIHYRLSDPEGTLRAYGVMLHLASRLPGVIDPDEICLTEACRSLGRQVHAFRPLGPRLLRGVPQPTELYLLDGIDGGDGWRSSDDAGVPFFGRQLEMDILTAMLDRALDGRAEVVCVVGAPGTGKTRLCREFARSCGSRSIPVFRVGIQPHGATSPLRSLGLLLKEACFAAAGAETTVAVVASVLASIGTGSPGDLALVCGLLGLPVATKPDLLTARARTARLVEIVRRLVRRPTDKPGVLVVEDVHWIDEPARLLLLGLAQAVPGSGTMLVLNGRPADVVSALGGLGRTIELDELSPSNSSLLVENLLGSSVELGPIRAQVVARSAGNPFFAEELVRSLVDDGAVLACPGGYAVGEPSRVSALPLTVQAVIGSRLGHLAKRERELVQLSAVVGKEFQVGLIQAASGSELEELTGVLDRLRLAGIVRVCDDADDERYEFRHPLIHEVAYGMQLKERRSRLHGEIARALRDLHPDCDGDMAQVIAVHLEEAGQFEAAASYAAQAARWWGQHSSSAAIERWHKVRTLLARVAASGDNSALGIEANGQVAWLGWREGHRLEQVEPFLREALASAILSGHPMTSLLMSVAGRMAQVSGGDADEFVRTLLEAIDLSRTQGDTGRVATLNASLSHAYGWAGLLKHALVANDAALADAHMVADADQQFLGYDVRDWALSLRGRIMLRLGMVSSARQCFDLIIGRKGSIDPTVAFVGHFGYVELAQFTDDVAMATEHAGYLETLVNRHGNAYLTFYAAVARALASGVAGHIDEAMHGIRSCLALQQRSGAAVEFEPELRASLADLQRRSGLLDEAFSTALEAEALARARNARLPLCRSLIVQAEAAVLAGRSMLHGSEIRMALDLATALVQETGARLYLPLLERAQALVGRKGSEGRTSKVNSASP